MSLLLTIGLFFIAALDMRIFRRQDLALSRKVFHFSIFWIGFWVILSVVLILSGSDPVENLSAFLIVFVLPVYILRRQQFKQIMKRRDANYAPDRTHEDVLLSDLYSVIFLGLLGVVLFSVVASAIVKLCSIPDSQMGEMLVTNLLSFSWILYLTYRSLQKYSSQGFLSAMRFGSFGEPFWKIIILPVVIGIIFAYASSWIILTRDIQPQTPLSELVDSTQSSFWMMVFLLTAVFIAPLVEELIFRGYLFSVLKQTKGLRLAVFITAFSFAVLHMGQYWGDWAAILMVGLLGFVLTGLRAWTKTTLASVILHYVYNTGVTLIPVVMLYVSNPSYFEYQMMFQSYTAEKQIELLQKSVERDPDLPDAYNDLAWIYAENNKNLEEALVLVGKALSYQPDSGVYWDTKATILERMERFDEAGEIREKLLENKYKFEVKNGFMF
jgi:membrane protease YdiL (CAAX protease family)